MRILIIEDNAVVADAVREGLKEVGHVVTVELDGQSGFDRVTAEEFDLLILDRMLPSISGDEICHRMRGVESRVPILMLTARAAVGDCVEGLDLGADDYLTKPFAFSELLARVRALLRRGDVPTPPILRLEDLELNPTAHTVERAGKRISLSAREFTLLEFLLRNAERVVSRKSIVAHVWGDELSSNAVEVYMTYLRRKVDKAHEVKLIHTVRGVGYVMRKDP
ncbi:MAG: DNA-binding response OmpR family regulator [Planctomycetota bacterium]